MPRERPVHYPALGEYFAGLRLAREWGQKEAAEMAARKGLRALTRQVLLRLERGQVKNPEPAVLKAIAALYAVPYHDVVARFVTLRFGISPASDLTGQTRDQQSAAGAPANDPAAASMEELERLRILVDQYQKEAREVRTVSDALAKVTLALEEIRKAPGGTAARRRRDRKVG